MKKLAAVFAVLALVALSAAFACDKEKSGQQAAGTQATAKDVTLTGLLTDSRCGADSTKAKKSCHHDCMKKGAKLQLVADDKVYILDKVESPESLLGQQVTVTGTLDESTNTITVASIVNVDQEKKS
jgi:hypothetical protein